MNINIRCSNIHIIITIKGMVFYDCIIRVLKNSTAAIFVSQILYNTICNIPIGFCKDCRHCNLATLKSVGKGVLLSVNCYNHILKTVIIEIILSIPIRF